MIISKEAELDTHEVCNIVDVVEWLTNLRDAHVAAYVRAEGGEIVVEYDEEETDDEVRRREGIASEIVSLSDDLISAVKENKKRDTSIRVIQGDINKGNQRIAEIRNRLAKLRR